MYKVSEKDSRFFVISNSPKKLTHKSTFFTQFPHDMTKKFDNKINNFFKKWEDLRVLNKKWANYIKSNYCKRGTKGMG